MQGRAINNLQKPWRHIRKLADLEDVQIHDQRRKVASVALKGGMSLPMLDSLLRHTQPATTARYSHLAIDPLKRASELVFEQIQSVH